jgi:hypothetical protein
VRRWENNLAAHPNAKCTPREGSRRDRLFQDAIRRSKPAGRPSGTDLS